MLLTREKAINLDLALEKFFKAIGRKERIRNRINRLAEENYKTFLPKVKAWMEFTIKEINKAFRKKYIRKSADGKTEYYAWIDFKKDKAIDITTKLLDWEKLDEAGKRMLKPAGLDIMAKSGNEAYKIAGIEASFDILNPEAVKAVDRICSKAVKEVGKETKQAINHVIREGIKEGKNMGRVAKELRPLVGLTERQVKAVKNYENWLIKKRPDLSDLKRAQWVERYNKKLHRYRTEMISRTESMRATNEGNLIGYKEAGYATVRWSANVGCCDLCDAENGHVYTIEESRGMLPLHPDCRCSWLPESKVKPKPKPVIPKIPRRMHLKEMNIGERELQTLKDAEKTGIKMSTEQAENLVENFRDFTLGDYNAVREYQQKGIKYLETLDSKYAKKILKMTKDIEDYVKWSPKYNGAQAVRTLELSAKQTKYFANLKPGSVIDMKGTSFWTSSDDISSIFGDVSFTIMNPKGGASITHLSDWGAKAEEILFGNNTKFKIMYKPKMVMAPIVPAQTVGMFHFEEKPARKILEIYLKEI